MGRQPSLRRRRLAAALAQLRKNAKLSQVEAAQRLGAGWDGPRLSRVESMSIPISGDDTHDLAVALGADEKTVAALVDLARQSRKRGWWISYDDDVLGRFSDFVELEEDAKIVRVFVADMIPGYFQTEAYIKEVVKSAFPNAADEEVAQRVQLRLDRQKRMMDHGFTLWAVIDEAALLRPTGGAAVMAEQLEHLAVVARRPGITVQILPTSIAAHPAMGVPFTLLELNDGVRYVYLDNLTGGAYVEGFETTTYGEAWEILQALAGDFAQSAKIIQAAAANHRRVENEQI